VLVEYRGQPVGEHRLDLLVEGVLVVELKAVKALEDTFFATTRSYMKAVGVEDGLILNFATMPLTIKRVGRELRKPEACIRKTIRNSVTQEKNGILSCRPFLIS
jgi:hypothetical protein